MCVNSTPDFLSHFFANDNKDRNPFCPQSQIVSFHEVSYNIDKRTLSKVGEPYLRNVVFENGHSGVFTAERDSPNNRYLDGQKVTGFFGGDNLEIPIKAE